MRKNRPSKRRSAPLGLLFLLPLTAALSRQRYHALDFQELRPHTVFLSKTAQLQAKDANLPAPIAVEALDFLEFLTAKKRHESPILTDKLRQLRGALKGRLSSSDEFSAKKPMISNWKSESHVVLDACALIAFFNDKPGAEIVDSLLQGAPIIEMFAVIRNTN